MVLNGFGKVVKSFGRDIPRHFSGIVLDEFVVMLNHIYGVLWMMTSQTM